eukprot:676371-Hanusia_phi.AAC.1
MSWWSRLLEGDQAIDVQKIEPENSNLADLSPDIRCGEEEGKDGEEAGGRETFNQGEESLCEEGGGGGEVRKA